MTPANITALLKANTYPGRGILIGRSADDTATIAVYFIMGRSENSRNRVFVKTQDGIRTKAFDNSKLTDPSLVIYNPVRTFEGSLIVTNGDQTDTIFDHLKASGTFRSALSTRQFEPDKPNYTPRISGIITPGGAYDISILKTLNGNPDSCCRFFFEYNKPTPGLGHFISTYLRNGDPLPSFEGEPITVNIPKTDNLMKFADDIWNSLNYDNKISLYAKITGTQIANDLIINKYKEAGI